MTESLDKIKYIESISNFDRVVIDRLIKYSHDDNLIVRYHAYRKLNSADDHYELIDKIYGNLFGRLAYVCKEIVRETTYFKP